MKIKCHLASIEGCLVDARDCIGSDDCMVDVDVPTADLIAELERRRPCAKCDHPCHMGGACIQECCYQPIDKADNFKPRSEEYK